MKDAFQNLPSFAESHGCKPVVECKRVPSIALAKEDTLRRVSPDEARGEVPQALARGTPRPPPVQARALGGVQLTLSPSFVTQRYVLSRVASQEPTVAAWLMEIESSPSKSRIP